MQNNTKEPTTDAYDNMNECHVVLRKKLERREHTQRASNHMKF